MNIYCNSGIRKEMNLRDILKMRSTGLGGCFGMVHKEGEALRQL